MSNRVAVLRHDRMLAALKRGAALATLVAGVIAGDPARADDPPNGLHGTFGESAATPDVVPASGAMTYAVPFVLPAARGGAQPSLSLSYASGAGSGEAGHGWSLDVPSIERAPLSGWPKYVDPTFDSPNDEDRYAYDGRPLTFICVVGGDPACPSGDAVGPMPGWASGYRHYRLQVEGSFERFFQSEDRSRWIVQRRGGEILEFGIPLTRTDLPDSNAVDVDAGTAKIFRWNLVRQRDLHGDLNLAVYQWAGGAGERKYLQHIYYTPPAANTSAASLDSFAYHVELSWWNPPYRQEDFTRADRWRFYKRLRRVGVSAKSWSDPGSRELVRAYNLEYFDERSVPGLPGEAPFWGRSSLRSVQMEGRCAVPVAEIDGRLPDPTGCTPLPPTTFEYQEATLAVGEAIQAEMTGHWGDPLPYVTSTTIVDVDRDGLPDIVQSWPQTRGSIQYTECQGAGAVFAVTAAPGECADEPGQPYVCHPALSCVQGVNVLALRSARAQLAFMNGGPTAGGAASFAHNCLDAGDGTQGTVTGYHVRDRTIANLAGRVAALMTPFSAESVGDWGDAHLLWSIAGYSGFRIVPTSPGEYSAEAFADFCQQANGNPHPALRWQRLDDSATWVKYPAVTDAREYHTIVDIDGDGYPDVLTDPIEVDDNTYFKRASVTFTKKLSTVEHQDLVAGPALLPFSSTTSHAITVSPWVQDYSTYADVNGDGIVDLVTARADDAGGVPAVRLGDGRGGFGCNATDVACNVTGNGSWLGPAYRLANADATSPWPLKQYRADVDGTGASFFQDVTGDGLADIVTYDPWDQADPVDPTHGRVRLWVNVDGRTFRCANATDCVVATISGADQPMTGTPQYRVMFADIDGNGTEDFVLLGEKAVWHFSFLAVAPVPVLGPRAPKPGLLTRIRNGVGADTEIVYETIQELDLRAKSGDPGDPDSFFWPWTKHSPQVVPVVTRIATRDTAAAGGAPLLAPYRVDRARTFQYRDPAYDPWERSFKGFRRVRTLFSSGQVEQTWFYFGPCEDGGFINPNCMKGSESRAISDRQDRALAGAAVRVDRFIPGGGGRPLHWLSTSTTQFLGASAFIDPAGTTPDHPVAFSPAIQHDTYLYDTEVAVSVVDDIDPPTSDSQRAPEQAGRVHLRTTAAFDDAGNVKQSTALGRLAPDETSPLETRIDTVFLPEQGRCGGNWACDATEALISETLSGEINPRPLRHSKFDFNTSADLVGTWAELFYPNNDAAGLEREATYGTPAPWTASTAPGLKNLRIFEVDPFGNVTRIRGESGGNLPCTRVDFETTFAQFPERTRSYVGTACTGRSLRAVTTFDRGLGALTSRLFGNAALETTEYDGFGRLAAAYAPAPDLGPFATELATQIFHHTQAPTSWVEVKRRSDVDAYVTSLEIFNGVGEHVLGFDQADPTADAAPWIARGWTSRDGDGLVSVVRRPALFSDDPYVVANTAQPIPLVGDPLSVQRDAFGRPMYEYDGDLPTAHYTHLPLEVHMQDAEQLKANGPYAGLESSRKVDGHGRVIQEIVPVDNAGFRTTEVTYLGTGEPITVRRTGTADPAHVYQRSLGWDSFGRLIHNWEPNTMGTRGVHYVYDDESRLVGTSDARGCGKNLHYDALSRLIAEDFSPCLAPPEQPAYSSPDLVTGDGTEAFYQYDVYEADQVAPTADFADDAELALGHLVSVHDRGAHTRFSYDSRGRVRRVTKRIARPGAPADTLADRYAAHFFKQESQFDLGDRVRTRTTGLESVELTGGGSSFETRDYTARGALRTLDSSYGALVTSMTYAASGQPLSIEYGDRAATKSEMGYDTRDRLRASRVSRVAAPGLWTTAPPPDGYSLPTSDTTQLTLDYLEFSYDDVGNPTSINDASADYWPAGAKPVSKSFQYDAAYRIKQVDYANLGDSHEPAFGPEARVGDRRPIAEVRGANRVQTQTFSTDWQGNVVASDDNESMRFDRSLGTILNGTGVDQIAHGPNQLIDADGIHADYDDAGNLVELTVARPNCWGDMPECSHRFRYDWDEVGQMTRARRWDFPGGPVPPADPNVNPVWDLSYSYGGGSRTLTSVTDAQGVPRHTLDVFATLRISRVTYQDANTDYFVEPENEVGFLGGVARVFYDRANALPKGADTYVHVFFDIGDHLGSTAFIIDKDTGEVVERSSHQAYGALDGDFRPDRWGASREEFKFTGKEEDIEVGVSYFGARYLNARLGRWMSADPLTVHGLGGDLNPYAYVAGRVTSFTDPFGLDGCGRDPACGDVEVKGPKRGSKERAAELANARGVAMAEHAASRNGADPTAVANIILGTAHIPIPGTKKKYFTPSGIRKVAVNAAKSTLIGILDPVGYRHVLALDGVDIERRTNVKVAEDDDDASEIVGAVTVTVAAVIAARTPAAAEAAAGKAGGGAQPITTVIGRMKDLAKFASDPAIDTWAKSGRIPAAGEPPVTWAENAKWLTERVARGDSFGIATDPATLPPVKGGYIPGVPNGYFTARELSFLRGLGIEPIPFH